VTEDQIPLASQARRETPADVFPRWRVGLPMQIVPRHFLSHAGKCVGRLPEENVQTLIGVRLKAWPTKSGRWGLADKQIPHRPGPRPGARSARRERRRFHHTADRLL